MRKSMEEKKCVYQSKIVVNLHENGCVITFLRDIRHICRHFIWYHSDKFAKSRKKFEWRTFFLSISLNVFQCILSRDHIKRINRKKKIQRIFIGIQIHNFTVLQHWIHWCHWFYETFANTTGHNASFSTPLKGFKKYWNEYWTKINYLSNDCYASHIHWYIDHFFIWKYICKRIYIL